MDRNLKTTSLGEQVKKPQSKRFVNYILSRSTGLGISAQTAQFDTMTGHAIFASDFFFKPEELKHW